jgi:protein required for attachment to host cells
MPHHMPRTWVLAMNATRARILRRLEDDPDDAENDPPGAAELVLRTESRHLKDVMADAPGRSFSSGSAGRRSAIAYGSDPLAEDERLFVGQVAMLLDAHRRSGDFDRLAVFAEPGTLGMLRRHLPERLRAVITAEVPRNLLHLTPHELRRAVRRDLAGREGGDVS